MPAQSSEDGYDLPAPPPRIRKRTVSNSVNKPSVVGGGLLSNVFTLVSREVGEFVNAVTGGSEASTSQPVAGPSRARDGGPPRMEKRHRRISTPSQSQHEARASKRVRREREDRQAVELRREDAVDHGVREPVVHHAHPPRSPSSRRSRSASITMPGSLFSRSPTPDSRPVPPDPQGRHVRFASDVISPVPRGQRRIDLSAPAAEEEEEGEGDEEDEEGSQGDDDYEGGASSDPSPESIYPPLPSPPRRLSLPTAGSSSHPSPTTPFRPLGIRSVKDAVAKLDGDTPPQGARPRTPSWSPQGKGKAREVEPQSPWLSMDKGNGKEPVRPRLDVTSRLPSTAGAVEGARRVDDFFRTGVGDTAGGVEDSSRGSSLQDEADKRRIQELEERIKNLEKELARRPLPPPPPPAPPPPPLSTGPTSRIPRSSSPRRGTGVNTVLASVRASLKQTPNEPEVRKAPPKNRLPTVPTDKMEAFLSELKTVRLRKTGSGDLSRDTTASNSSGWSGRDYSQSSSQGSSLLDDRSTAGFKRKRVDSGNEVQSALFTSIKRRFTVPSQSSTASTSVAGPSRAFLQQLQPTTLPHLRNSRPMPHMPAEVDGTTPSLCSDNDNSIEDRAPSTPPLAPSRSALEELSESRREVRREPAPGAFAEPQHIEVRPPRERPREREHSPQPSHEFQTKAPLSQSGSPSAASGRSRSSTVGQRSAPAQQRPPHSKVSDDPFSRRPPSSPLVPATPRRPRPPARVRSETKVASRAHTRSHSPSLPDSDDDDPLLLSFSPPDDESTPAPDPIGRRRPAHRPASRQERRLTLEDEIRRVDSSYSEEERAINELESGVLIGIGQKSKQLGFLAHGGAGGDPVLMGVGYVEGAVDETQPKNARKEKKGKPSAGGKRKPRR